MGKFASCLFLATHLKVKVLCLALLDQLVVWGVEQVASFYSFARSTVPWSGLIVTEGSVETLVSSAVAVATRIVVALRLHP